MAQHNILVINCDIGETRVALIENGIIAELHIELRLLVIRFSRCQFALGGGDLALDLRRIQFQQ